MVMMKTLDTCYNLNVSALGGSAIFQGSTLSSTLGKEWLLELFFAGEGVVAARVGPNTNKLRLDVQSRHKILVSAPVPLYLIGSLNWV